MDFKFIFIFIFIGIISYEIHFYSSFYLILSFLSFFFLLALIVEKEIIFKLKEDKFLVILLFFYFFSLIISSLFKFDLIGLNRSLMSFFIIFIIFNILQRLDLNYFFKILGFLGGVAILSLLIEFNLISLWGYVVERNASIFFDPNFAAAILGVCFFSIIIFNNNLYYKIIFSILLLISIFLTFSKSALIGVLISLTFLIARTKPSVAFIFLIISTFFGYFIYEYVDFRMFRAEQAFNNRDIMWRYVFDKVFNEQMFFGLGENGLADDLKANSLVNSSTHNAFIDILGKYGIPSLIFYFLLIFYSLIKAFFEKNRVFPLLMFMVIMCNSITYTVGGIGFLSIMLAICVFSVFFYEKKYI